jgi:hypothetical protein
METQFLLDLIQEITGKHAFKQALFNLKQKPSRPESYEPPGTLVNIIKERIKTFAEFNSDIKDLKLKP